MPSRERLTEIVTNVTRMFSRLAGMAIIAGTAASLFGDLGHWFDLFTHFPQFYLLGGLFFAALLFLTGGRRQAVLVAAVALVNAGPVAAWLPSPSGAMACDTADKVVVINAYVGNERHDLVERYVRREAPAVLVVSELVPGLHEQLRPHFAHSVYERLRRGSGIGIYSRYPMKEVQAFASPRYAIPQLDAVLQTPGGDIRVLAAHPIAPFHPEATDDRNRTLDQLVERTRSSRLPVLLAGDLNVSMWSPHYTPLERTGLHNARQGRGLMPTFPVHSPVRIPIDHVMHTAEIATCDFSVGEDINSDHFPIVAHMKWPDTGSRIETLATR